MIWLQFVFSVTRQGNLNCFRENLLILTIEISNHFVVCRGVLRGQSFGVIWPWKEPASGRGSFWEISSFVPWLVFNACRDGSGVVPECPGSSGFIRKSSSRASAPRTQSSVPLNSFDSLFMTLPSISSET